MREKIAPNIYYDRDKKTYIVYFNYGKDENGKYIRKTKTFKDIRSARKALKTFESEKINEDLASPSGESFYSYSERWLQYKEASCEAATIYGYQTTLKKHIYPYFGSMSIQSITTKTINDYIYFKTHCGKEDSPLSLNSVRKHYDLLKQIFDRVVDDKIIKENPLNSIMPPKKTKPKIEVYTADQLRTLFSISEGTRMEVIIKLAGYLGLRREEICGLKWKSVNFEKNIIYINNAITFAGKNIEKETKTVRSTRALAVPSDLMETLKELYKAHQSYKESLGLSEGFEYVASMGNGRPIRPNYVSDCFKKMIDDANLPPITLHGLRHSFASVANELGIPLYEISTSLGHSSTSTTEQIYIKLFNKNHKDTVESVAEAIKS